MKQKIRRSYDLEPDPVLVGLAFYRRHVHELNEILIERLYGHIDCDEAFEMLNKKWKEANKELRRMK